MEKSLRAWTALEIAQERRQQLLVHKFVRCIYVLATATIIGCAIWGWHLFHSELPIVQLLFEAGV